MRGDSRLAVLIIGLTIAPSIIKKSKPMARYFGGQLIKLGEALKRDGDYFIKASQEATAEPPPVATIQEPVEPAMVPEVAVTEPTAAEANESSADVEDLVSSPGAQTESDSAPEGVEPQASTPTPRKKQTKG